ncbi:MAG: hypothetical protein WCJ30_24150 [Deltaproteobacteria bacterium]
MLRIAFALFAAVLAVPCLAHAQGYSVVGGGSTHGDAQPAPATGPAAGANTNTPPAAAGGDNSAPEGSASVTAAGRGGPRAVVAPAGETASGRQPWDYAGLTPGSAAARIPGLSRREARRAGSRAVVAWPGFQMTPTGSRVFVATTRPVTVSGPVHTPGRWTFVLAQAYIPLSNNRRPLETAAFETPVDRAYVRQRGHDAELVIETRADAQPQMTQQNGATGGLSLVFVDFQAWSPPNHVPRILRDRPRGQQGVRLSPGQEGPGETPGVDDERPPPVQR